MSTNFYDLDFQTLKTAFKNFVKSEGYFADYNFEGSAINHLLDVFAQSIMYHAFYLNMATNELFLDSAQLNDSVYKIANMLNYLPSRKKAASITVAVTNSSGASILIPKYSAFTMGTVVLTAMENFTVPVGTSNITLYEGTWTTKEFISDGTDFQRYELTDKNSIDNDFFYVFVYPYDEGTSSYTVDTTIWTLINKNTFTVGGKNYYLEQLDKFWVKFDNGTICQKPELTDKVIVSYLKTSGDTYNGNTGTITLTSSFTGSTSLAFSAGTNALINGVDEEAIESIRLNAPQFYVSNNRAVTESDYNAIIKKYSYYSALDDAFVWGGQRERVNGSGQIIGTGTNYDVGYVYWTGLKSNLDYLSNSDITNIEAFLENYRILTLQFKHLNPSMLYIVPDIRIKFTDTFDIDLAAMKTDINTNFFADRTGFNTSFNLSNLIAYVDSLPKVERVTVNYNTYLKVKNSAYSVARIWNRIVPGSISAATPGGDMTDDGLGNLVWNTTNIGTVNYISGQMIIEKDFGVTSYDVSFTLYDTASALVSRETYLNFDDYNIIVLTS
jgi:hypothetical protein